MEIISKAGLKVPMITAAIRDTSSPHAENILRSASALGIRYYRWGGFLIEDNRSIPEQLEEMKPKVRDLAALNSQYNMAAIRGGICSGSFAPT